MLLCANGFDPNSIVDQADLIPLPIAFIEALDDGTGKGGALEAKIKSLTGRAIFYFAFPAMFRLADILPMTPQARLFCSQMCIADRAVHPAGRQHSCGYFRVCFHGWIHRSLNLNIFLVLCWVVLRAAYCQCSANFSTTSCSTFSKFGNTL
jgi:hypothetical protein